MNQLELKVTIIDCTPAYYCIVLTSVYLNKELRSSKGYLFVEVSSFAGLVLACCPRVQSCSCIPCARDWAILFRTYKSSLIIKSNFLILVRTTTAIVPEGISIAARPSDNACNQEPSLDCFVFTKFASPGTSGRSQIADGIATHNKCFWSTVRRMILIQTISVVCWHFNILRYGGSLSCNRAHHICSMPSLHS